MANKLFPWPIVIVFISYVGVTSGTRVYPQPGVVLKDSGYSLGNYLINASFSSAQNKRNVT